MWITKTIFIGSSGNETTEVTYSTTLEFANYKRESQLCRWYNILVDSNSNIPSGLKQIIQYTQDLTNIRLEMIQFVLAMSNKYDKKEVERKFSIEVYESANLVEETNLRINDKLNY